MNLNTSFILFDHLANLIDEFQYEYMPVMQKEYSFRPGLLTNARQSSTAPRRGSRWILLDKLKHISLEGYANINLLKQSPKRLSFFKQP